MSDLRVLVSRLTELGIAARISPTHHGKPPTLRLRRGTSAARLGLITGPKVRLSTLPESTQSTHFFVHTRYVGPKTAETFRRRQVQYLDEAGNAWIQFGDVLIDVRGRRPVERDTAVEPQIHGDLFTSGRAQIIMALLAWPQLWERPQRELARAAGASLGQTNKTKVLLETAGYGPGRGHRSSAELLETWAAAFPSGLAGRLFLAAYRGAVDAARLQREHDGLVISGELAVPDLLRSDSLLVYVPHLDPRLPLRQRWRSDGETNIVVRRKFWASPAWAEPDSTSELSPWPIVYADLLASEDPRARDAARQVRDRHI